jgi:hypothetical protein
MKIIKGPSGFGDAIYTRVVTEWLVENRPDEYIVQTKYPNIFRDLPVETMEHGYRGRVDYDLKYLSGKANPQTTQFQDMLQYAGLADVGIELTSFLKNDVYRDVTLIIDPYAPMNGVDSSLPMKPNEAEFEKLVSAFKNEGPVYRITHYHDFFELVDMFNSSRLVISQVGWAIPLAEMLDVNILTLFTKRALESENHFINTITPNKICQKVTTLPLVMY